MFTKTKIALSALIVLGTASAAFAQTDLLRENQIDDGSVIVETVVQPRPAAHVWVDQQLDRGTVNAADY